ncbi:Glycosyltransferase, GT2 family [Parapedobacter composti]|uniref:Glycosyltransferase, GT2 family n=1 Tax=Parapedobacter composti TaxID=623281 RepID=A0A1I1DZ62_9SPHI|nr:glycosyltransferase [Parapedobacter composti]SFB78288.1 Glycosyltransferase, GT2 family [Parapedobacter composti]
MGNKLTRWIDNKSHSVCLIISRIYYSHKERGQPVPIFKISFLVAARLFLVILCLFRFNKSFYLNYRNRTLYEFWMRLIGVNKFEIRELLPLTTNYRSFSLPVWDDPHVSIIVCAYNHIAYTYNCIQTVYHHTQNVSYEVLVVNDCSTDDTSEILASIKNLRVLNNETNIGFLRSCNKALRYAKGAYVCFLNNDVQVRPGWLYNLLVPFRTVEGTGLVGARLVYPYGLLQEAGGIVDYEGQPANFGRFSDPNHPYYIYLRETDYCSGACIVLPRADLETLHGFDEKFSPAYYEDTDLAFRVRYQLNKKVVYQPLAEVIHFEGVSSGKTPNGNNVKRYQSSNAALFLEKWGAVFRTFPSSNNLLVNARKWLRNRKTILVIEETLPTYDQDSGSRRMFELIKLFFRLNYEVIFLADSKFEQEPYRTVLINMGVWVLHRPAFKKSFDDELRLLAPMIDLAWICRPSMNRKYGKLIKRLGIAWINDTIDLHFLREERALRVVGGGKADEKKMLRAKQEELSLIRSADTAIAITPTEAGLLNEYGIKHISVIPNIHRLSETVIPGFHDRRGICFIGGYRHIPNIDAARWLVNDIMPLVWQKRPDINVYLLGSAPPPEILKLQSKNVFVPGYLDDVSPYFLSSKVFAAPLRFGAGMKGKIGQSFEYRLPVVTTNIGAEGMGLKVGKNYLLAETAPDFANAILALYENEALWVELAKGGAEALEPYLPDTVMHKLSDVLDSVQQMNRRAHCS